MAFRLLDQKPQYRNAAGELLASGTLNFYITATSTAKNVYSDKTLGTSLGSTITLDSDGRHSEDIWLAEDTAYRVIAKDADGVTVWQLEDVRAVDSSVSVDLPDASGGTDGQALFTDGTDGGWYFDDVLTIPSQTGNADKYLTTDGESLSWAAFGTGSDTVTATAGSSGKVVMGDVTLQWGSDACPIAAAIYSTKAVTFGTAFSGTPYYVGVTPTVGGVTSDTPSARCSAQALSATSSGFTASVFAGAEDEGIGSPNITAQVTFNWLAIGPT